MTRAFEHDAVVVGSGPNGLAASIALARSGLSVLLLESESTVGGGTRTAELTLPGFRHDICSAVHPVGAASPFFRELDVSAHGLEWLHPSAPLAHPLDDGTAVVLERSLDETVESLGGDGPAYRQVMEPLVLGWEAIASDLLGPLRWPKHPTRLARFGLKALRSARGLAERKFSRPGTRALWAGLGAHSILPLEKPFTATFPLMLGSLGHAVGWPVARGGSQSIAEALAACLRALGGRIETGARVRSLDDLPKAKCVLLDITPRELLRMAGPRLPAGYRRRLESHRYGPGVFKIDWALDGPIPWRAEECSRAGTVHLGGTMEEIAVSESSVWSGLHPERPFVIVAQQSLFDPTRVPDGKHAAWAYCHVPNGSDWDMTDRIEAQVERFAPGFRDRVMARSVMNTARIEEYNPNYVGGDIAGGAQDFWQVFARPFLSWGGSYATPLRGVYICSASTPPGGGVHGMCGYHAACAALKRMR